MPERPLLPDPHALPVSASVPTVSPNFTQSFKVVLVGPVVIPAPVPASALLLVTVVAEAATGICPAVMPETPLEVRYVFVSSENVPAAVIFTNGVPEDHVG